MQNAKTNMLTGNIFRSMVLFAIPIFFGNLFQILKYFRIITVSDIYCDVTIFKIFFDIGVEVNTFVYFDACKIRSFMIYY